MPNVIKLPHGLTSVSPTIDGADVSHDRLLSPPIEPGDVTIVINGKTADATNLPTVDPQGIVTLELTAAEAVDGAIVTFRSAGGQWLRVDVHLSFCAGIELASIEAQVDAIAAMLTPERLAKLDLDLAHADDATIYRGRTILTPAFANVARRECGGTIRVFNNEKVNVHAVVSNDDGVVDLTGENLWFGVEGEDRESLFTAAPNGVTDGFEVEVQNLTATSCDMWWALRLDDSTGRLIASGRFEIAYRPYDRR